MATETSLSEFQAFCAKAQADAQLHTAAIVANTLPDGPAMLAAIESVQRRARYSAADELKRRARDYQARPAMLEILYPGLACCEPRRMIAIGEVLLETELYARLDFIPVKRLNAKAVILLGRFNRRLAAPQSARGLRTTVFAEAL